MSRPKRKYTQKSDEMEIDRGCTKLILSQTNRNVNVESIDHIDWKTFNALQLTSRIATERDAFMFAQQLRLIPVSMKCPGKYNSGCNKNMVLTSDLKNWRCPRPCKKRLSSRTYTFNGNHGHLTWSQILLILYFYNANAKKTEIMFEAFIGSNETIQLWCSLLQKLPAMVLSSIEFGQIGGSDRMVEINNLMCCKLNLNNLTTSKYEQERVSESEQEWWFAGICRNDGQCFVVKLETCDEQELIPLILKYIKPGTTVISDERKVYNKLNNLGYKQQTVSEKDDLENEMFADVDSPVTEPLWRVLNRVMTLNEEKKLLVFMEYLYKCHFDLQNQTAGEKFKTMINNISILYPVSGETP